MKYAVETFNFTRKFGKKFAVKDLNLQVPAGSIFAFLGPNGAGKTTTIKTLMNIMTPTSGSAKVLGVNSQKLSPKEFQQIGYVSENQEMPEWMTVGQFLNYCKPMYPTWDDAFCRELVKQFDIPLNEKLKNISRGMKMKAALVSSLAYRPKLIVLDEPFSGLDPLVRQEFIDGILKLTESENWTVFISSHDIDEVERIADGVGIIDHAELKIHEKIEALQNRFRKVSITLNEPVPRPVTLPESWFLVQHRQRVMEFFESQYQPGLTEERIKNLYPACVDISVTGINLREIFLVLAKEYKISSLNGNSHPQHQKEG